MDLNIVVRFNIEFSKNASTFFSVEHDLDYLRILVGLRYELMATF